MVAFVAVFTLASGQEPARPPEAKAEIRGRVTDKQTGRPLAGAIVSLDSRSERTQHTAITATDGTFRFTDLEPGRYFGIVMPGQFRGTHLFQPLVTAPDAYVELAKGEVRRIDVALPRGYALPVRVLDGTGIPLSDIRISAINADTGRLVNVFVQHMTDDQGRMRLFGLDPGRYIVCGESWLAGGTARDRLLRTCYPAADNESGAEAITIDRDEIGEIEIRMRRGRTYSISALVLDSTGAITSTARVSLNRYDENATDGLGLRHEDGRFRLEAVPPGTYAVEATLGGEDQPEARRPLERAFVPIVVNADTPNLTVILRRTIEVPGRLVLEDPTLTLPPSEGPLGVWSRADDPLLPRPALTHSALVRQDRTFLIKELFGRRALSMENLPRGWYAKSIRYNGADVTGQTIDFDRVRDPGDIEVVLSNRGAMLSGRVLDDSGNPVPKAIVFVVPLQQRTTLSLPHSTTSADGSFRFGPARGGEYSVVALPASRRPPSFEDRERLARLIALGERITLGELDERTVDLRIVKERQ